MIPGLRHEPIKYTARRDRESEQLFVSFHKERSKTSIKKLERNATRNSCVSFHTEQRSVGVSQRIPLSNTIKIHFLSEYYDVERRYIIIVVTDFFITVYYISLSIYCFAKNHTTEYKIYLPQLLDFGVTKSRYQCFHDYFQCT